MRFFSIEYSDLRWAQTLYQQECFWMWFFTQAISQSLEKNDQFKNKHSFLGEGQKLSWGDSEIDNLLNQILCLQGRAIILLRSLLKKWDSA